MSQSEKHWYQDGGVVLFITALCGIALFVGLNIWKEIEEENRPVAFTLLTGRLDGSLLTEPTLHISVWHQFPGTLRNGTLTVTTDSSMVEKRAQFQIHSFEEWDPNRDAQIELTFQLHDFDPQQEIPLTVRLEGKNSQPYRHRFVWLGNDWKSNQVE
ncbi:MAG: hypothetical protein KDA90_09240 [Planctomycetaceae bacterium]|nr:hypothetical protein [Planctomycetaceae bacterium]